MVGARETTLVHLRTSDGVEGWGECFGPTAAVVPLVHELAEQLRGRGLDAPGAFVTSQLQQHYHRGGGLHASALSGLDTAMWDALGKTLNVSVATLLGGRTRDFVVPYASCGYVRDGQSLEEFADELAASATGFQAAKIKCGFGPTMDSARTAAARETLGDDAFLMVDFNGNYSADQSRTSIRAMEASRPAWVEEPLAPDDVDGLRLLRPLDVALATGEALYTRAPFRRLITERLIDVVQPDITKIGGLSEARAVCEMARAWGVRVSPHVWGGGIALAAAVQLLGSIPDYPHTSNVPEPIWLELDRGANALRDELVTEPLSPVDGIISLPTRPGLGVDIDKAALARLREDR
nr:mandelate racemase/muconate lactonizing enzyme family protein [Nesterenkonia sp. Act20]